jgi:hypothetical protein
VSQTGIEYRKSPLSAGVGLPANAPQAGDRFPWLQLRFAPDTQVDDSFAKLDDAHFHLLAFGQAAPDAPPAFGDLLRTHALPADPANDAELDRAGIPRTSFYLIRSDGHVALCGLRIDAGAVARYASETLGLKPPGPVAQPAAAGR